MCSWFVPLVYLLFSQELTFSSRRIFEISGFIFKHMIFVSFVIVCDCLSVCMCNPIYLCHPLGYYLCSLLTAVWLMKPNSETLPFANSIIIATVCILCTSEATWCMCMDLIACMRLGEKAGCQIFTAFPCAPCSCHFTYSTPENLCPCLQTIKGKMDSLIAYHVHATTMISSETYICLLSDHIRQTTMNTRTYTTTSN